MKEENGQVVIDQEHQQDMLKVFRKHHHAKQNNLLLGLPFVTVTEYLWELREIAKIMHPLGSRALFYLAAAVSDFFVPQDRMVEHKIQSNEEFTGHNEQDVTGKRQAARTDGSSLIIDLDPVPKFLKQLVDAWAPDAIIVSFKLETDPAILVQKAEYALKKYAHHLVIGNLLTTRKWEVVFVSDEGHKWIRVPRGRRGKSISGVEAQVGQADDNSNSLDAGDHKFVGEPAVEIESLIIPAIAQIQDRLIKSRSG
ncbi:DFP-domain-containing protein [Microthyrium microscopicum]|uniref:DFP-domain-containing protein n=1 Tax=Microthyrium microscopicum TaxID=703497 RepID=A0A6A6U4H8_9PEZI|nr:DFP-domain-containing protein [Microthyrium microscopicum]